MRKVIALLILSLCLVVVPVSAAAVAPCAYCDSVIENGRTQALTDYSACKATSMGNSYVLAGCLAMYYAEMGGVYAAWNQCEQTAPIAGLCLYAVKPTEVVG